jgi:glycosyltransferase involved in cell wall biosynthesis
MNSLKISFIIPVFNNFKYTKNIYLNLKEYFNQDEIVISDGGSTEIETSKYFKSVKDKNLIFIENKPINLCENYNIAVKKCTGDIVVLLHNDMFIPPDFKEKLLLDIDENSIISYSRIEPPIFPVEEPGKIVKNFGYGLEDLDKQSVIDFCSKYITKYEGGRYLFIACYKKNYIKLDEKTFNPPQCWSADEDLHVRYKLSGLKRLISNACVYHFVSKTSRTPGYEVIEQNSNKNFIRKWGFINSKYNKKYNVSFIIKNCTPNLIEILEPWCNSIFIENKYGYIESEQENTSFDLNSRVKLINEYNKKNEIDIEVHFDGNQFNQKHYHLIQNISDFISEKIQCLGEYQVDIFNIKVNSIKNYEKDLIFL